MRPRIVLDHLLEKIREETKVWTFSRKLHFLFHENYIKCRSQLNGWTQSQNILRIFDGLSNISAFPENVLS